jgi:hypothetical protein
MVDVFGNHAQPVEKCLLSKLEPYSVLGLISPVLCGIPFEIGHHPTITKYV